MTTEKKPHVHAEVIKAWADGATIEFRPGPFLTEPPAITTLPVVKSNLCLMEKLENSNQWKC